MNIAILSVWDLTLASMLVILLAVLSVLLKLDLAQRIIIAALRTVVQLSLIGLVLKVVFAESKFIWIAAMALAMLLIAGREVMARQHYRFKGLWGYGLGTTAMFISAFTTTLFALLLIIQQQPWYLPQYAIPLLGMLLGNTMTGVALSLDKLTTSVWQQQALIETRLALGDPSHKAIQPMFKESIRIGLIPIINAMAAAGVVSLPGMMTGQILAGTVPVEAVKYQILIMFLITAGTGFATIIGTWIGSKRLFDERHRLRLERLQPYKS